MRQFNVLSRWGWTFLVVVTLGLAGCDGDDGAAGAAGAAGLPGADGDDGLACWDLNGNGVGDPEEDINGDGIFDAADCGAGGGPVAEAVAAAKVESCSVCHGGIGDGHQAIYEQYVDASAFTLTLNSVSSVLVAPGDYTVTLNFSITENGAPYVDAAGLPGLDQKRFYMVRWDSAAQQYLQGNQRLNESNAVPGLIDGDYVLTQTGMPFAPETSNAHVYGYIAEGALFSTDHGPGSEIPAGSHVHLYDNMADDALAFGEAAAGDPNAYESLANVSGCEKCHGTPYLKHGYRAAQVANIPDFAACKSCHYDDRSGGHEEWQYMVDDPFNWATDGLPAATVEAKYAYDATVMNDTHMSHAMEFPYPQSAANCSTCHEGKLSTILADSYFTAATCKSCHAVEGVDTDPRTFDANGDEILGGRSGTSPVPEIYAQPLRAPSLAWLWSAEGGVNGSDYQNLHEGPINNPSPTACTICHGASYPGFSDYHTGYDASIYDASGNKYADTYVIDQLDVTWDDVASTLKIDFSASDPAILPEVLVSFYGWDSKNFIVPSHARDGDGNRFEYELGDANPLFSDFAEINPGEWTVTANLAAFVPADTDDILTLIADGVIKNAEVAITPTLSLAGRDVVLAAADQTISLQDGLPVADYFKGANSTVEIAKCNVCHDALASSFHDGSGRAGDGIDVCKHCHNPTFGGSHIEMTSRSIDSYVHAIHTFQDFDVDDTFEAFDPVFAARYDQHIGHVFPNFTITNCESCHRDGTYNAPDQAKSMPGLQSASSDVATWYSIVGGLAVEDPAGRNIGMVPEAVTGPASRACGGCHRGRLITDDAAGDLAALNAHVEAFGTYVENDDDDEVLFGIIDKIMSMFE